MYIYLHIISPPLAGLKFYIHICTYEPVQIDDPIQFN